MLTLTLNNEVIPLPVGFSMQLTWKSPVCDFQKIPSGYGLGISLPINEYTRPLFGNPERFAKQRTDSVQKYPGFEIRFSGVLLMAGTLVIDATTCSGTENSYEASLIDQVGMLGEKEQQRNILDIPAFSEEISWVQSTNYNPEEHPFCCFPILNHGFFKDKGIVIKREQTVPDLDRPGKTKTEIYDDELMSYLFNKTTGRYVNKLIGGLVQREASQIDLSVLTQKGNTYDTGKVTVVTPFFFLNYVIREALKDNGFHITDNFLAEDSQLKNLCIYNNYDITLTKYLQTGEIIFQETIIGKDEFGGVTLYAMPMSSGVKLYSYTRNYFGVKLDQDHIVHPGYWLTPKNHLPKMQVGDLILSTQNLANVCFHFLPDNTVSIHSRERILTGPSTDLEPYFLGVWDIGGQKSVALKFTREHDANDLVFADRYNDLSDRKPDIKQPVANWAEMNAITNAVEGDIRLMTSTNTFYEFKWITQEKVNGQTRQGDTTDALGWEEISIGLQNGWHRYGREQVEEIKTSWSGCLGNHQLTLVNQQGNMNTWKAKTQAFSPRLMINNPNNSGGTQNASFSFEYEKEGTGILPKYWKNWNQFWSERLPVSGDFDLPVNMLRYVIDNICSKYRTREGELLIEEMSCELFIDRIGVTEIKGFKV